MKGTAILYLGRRWKSPQSVYWKALIGCEETGILIEGSRCSRLVVQEVTQREFGSAHGFGFRGAKGGWKDISESKEMLGQELGGKARWVSAA